MHSVCVLLASISAFNGRMFLVHLPVCIGFMLKLFKLLSRFALLRPSVRPYVHPEILCLQLDFAMLQVLHELWDFVSLFRYICCDRFMSCDEHMLERTYH